jgi:hypothetical protein
MLKVEFGTAIRRAPFIAKNFADLGRLPEGVARRFPVRMRASSPDPEPRPDVAIRLAERGHT